MFYTALVCPIPHCYGKAKPSGAKQRHSIAIIAKAERVRAMPCGGIVAFCAAMALRRFDERGKGKAKHGSR